MGLSSLVHPVGVLDDTTGAAQRQYSRVGWTAIRLHELFDSSGQPSSRPFVQLSKVGSSWPFSTTGLHLLRRPASLRMRPSLTAAINPITRAPTTMIFSSIGLLLACSPSESASGAGAPIPPSDELARDQGLELPLELGELVAVSSQAAAEIVERVLEPLPLLGDELQEAVPFGLELTDLPLQLLRVPAGVLRLAL